MTSWTREGGEPEGEAQAATDPSTGSTSDLAAGQPVVVAGEAPIVVDSSEARLPLDSSPTEEHPNVDASPAPTDEVSSGAAPFESLPAEPEETTKKTRQPLRALLDLLHDLAIAVVVCVLLITYVVQAFKVQGTSMSPELADGERILVNKFIYGFDDIERGDVVVFWYPDDPELSFIKRVIGLPGETLEIRAGDVYLDGERIDEPYVNIENADARSLSPREIRPGHYFVLGDNRRGSNDSRSWGLVPQRYIYGKAFLRIWPLGELGKVE